MKNGRRESDSLIVSRKASNKIRDNKRVAEKVNWVLDVDIRGFFDAIDHEWLIRFVGHRIKDRRVVRHIRKWLKAGILEPDGMVIDPETGTPQGGIVSPVLANVSLHYALDLWFERVVKPHCHGEALLCRYADDWVCAFRYKRDATRFYTVLPKRLRACTDAP